MKKQDWIKDLQSKGDSYRQNPPEGLWKDISKQLDEKPVIAPVRFNWRRWSSIAAAVIVAAGEGLYWLLPSGKGTNEAAVAVTEIGLNESSARDLVNEDLINKDLIAEAEPSGIVAQPSAHVAKAKQSNRQGHSDVSTTSTIYEEETAATETEVSSVANNESTSEEAVYQDAVEGSVLVAETAIHSNFNQYSHDAPDDDNSLPEKSRSHKRWQFSFYGGGLAYSDLKGRGDLTTSDSFNGPDLPNTPDHPGGSGNDCLIPDDPNEKDPDDEGAESRMSRGSNDAHLSRGAEDQSTPDFGTAKHKMPLSFGAKVGIDLGLGWSLSTGLVYSYLASDFEKGIVHTDQSLHYLGIPLMVNYQAWTNGRFSFYVGAGGTMEKLVHGRATSHSRDNKGADITTRYSLSESRLQWSVNASVGVSVNLYRNLCLFLEPGIGYYFDNHSSICNIYKDKPWNFDLNIGVKLKLNTK